MFITIFVTVPNSKTTKIIRNALLEKKLIACVSVIDKVNSFYWWEGKIEHTKEMLLIMKSEKSKFAEIEKIIKELHPYKTPEIVCCEIVDGHKNYLKWIEQCLK